MTKQELQTTLGQNLRRVRLEQHLTIEQAAERVGISTTFYSNLECGNKMMSLVTFHKLSEVLGVSADTLMYGAVDTNERIKNLDTLLRDQTPEKIAFIEKMIRLCVSELSTGAHNLGGDSMG